MQETKNAYHFSLCLLLTSWESVLPLNQTSQSLLTVSVTVVVVSYSLIIQENKNFFKLFFKNLSWVCIPHLPRNTVLILIFFIIEVNISIQIHNKFLKTNETNKQLISFVPYSIRAHDCYPFFGIGISTNTTEMCIFYWYYLNTTRLLRTSLVSFLCRDISRHALDHAELSRLFFIASCLGNLAICLLLLKVFNFFATYSLIIQENQKIFKTYFFVLLLWL